VQAIVNLVASSVQGLSPSDVTVADTKGTVLSAPGLAGAAAGDAHAGDTAAYESRVTQSVQQMLDQIYGPGHAIVRVAATLNFDEKATTADAYGNEIADQVAGTTPTTVAGATTPTTGPALTQNQSTETFTGPSGSGTTGVLGVNGAPAAATGGNTNYSKNSSDTTYGVGKVHAEVRTAPGKIERLSVAVIVDGKKVQASDIPNVQSSVQAAVGLDATRGDTIDVSRMSFDQSVAKDAAKQLSSSDQQKKQSALFDMIKALVALLLVGVVLFLAWRAMKKAAAREPVRVPLDLRALEAGAGVGSADGMARLLQSQQLAQLRALEDHDGPASLEPAGLPEPTEMDQLEQDIVALIDRQPDEAAATLRSWLADRRS
jgi:flagellar M-ring protein FliF